VYIALLLFPADMFHAGTKWINISKEIHLDEEGNLVGPNEDADVHQDIVQNRLFLHLTADKGSLPKNEDKEYLHIRYNGAEIIQEYTTVHVKALGKQSKESLANAF